MYPGFLAPQGFTACPWVTVGAELLQLLTLYGVYVLGKGLHRPCWPGWSARHLTQPRIKAYLKLYVPAALAIASDFWRMAFIGAVAAHQGSLNLAVFNASYRVNRSSTRALISTPHHTTAAAAAAATAAAAAVPVMVAATSTTATTGQPPCHAMWGCPWF